MKTVKQLNIMNRAQCLFFIIRIVFITKKIFLSFYIKPYSKRSNVFNAYQNVFAMLSIRTHLL